MATLHILLGNSLVALFTIIVLGMMLGKIKIAGLSLGNSAVIFVALVFGHFHYTIPEGIGTLGLVLFIYCVGIGAGPSFFGVFARQGTKMVKLSVFIVGTASVLTYILSKVFAIPVDLSVGILAGALTSTPALAAAMDALRNTGPMVSVGYGMAYPFGVIGVALFVQILPRLLRKDLNAVAREGGHAARPEIVRYYIEVLNPAILGKGVADVEMIAKSSCQISRVFEKGRFIPLQRDTKFQKGQILLLVGEKKNADLVIDFIGEKSGKIHGIQIDNEPAEVVVTSENIIGKSLKELELLRKFGVTVTRINRLEMTFVPGPDTVIEGADRLTVVGDGMDLTAFAKAAGHRAKALHETDIISLTLGVLIGVIVGMIPFGLPGSKPITLGLSGGLLLVALILGHYGRVGKIVGRIPFAAQYLMRELGLVFFLAYAGVKAGGNFAAIVREYGIIPFLFGGAVTALPLIGGYWVAAHVLKLNLLEAMGGLCGGMTSTPGLGSVTAKTDSEIPVISYAAAYPVALVFIIILIHLFIALG